MSRPNDYGITNRVIVDSEADRAVESLRWLGYAVVPGGYSSQDLDDFSARFDVALQLSLASYGPSVLAEIDEHRTIRALLSLDPTFLTLARNPTILAVCNALMGGYSILNQQNGIINPPNNESYNQASWHRDLPYQHFVSSRPLALNALFCVDDFTLDNGSTLVLPATHKQEAFPSADAVGANSTIVTAGRGSFVVLDAMLFHSGGVNASAMARRAINHLYTIPMFRQQIDLPSVLGDQYADDPVLGPFLGYGVRTPTSVDEFYRDRLAKLRVRHASQRS